MHLEVVESFLGFGSVLQLFGAIFCVTRIIQITSGTRNSRKNKKAVVGALAVATCVDIMTTRLVQRRYVCVQKGLLLAH